MTTFTPEQRREIETTGHLRIEDPETHQTYVVITEADYQRVRRLAEEVEDRRESEAWGRVTGEARDAWMRENPY